MVLKESRALLYNTQLILRDLNLVLEMVLDEAKAILYDTVNTIHLYLLVWMALMLISGHQDQYPGTWTNIWACEVLFVQLYDQYPDSRAQLV